MYKEINVNEKIGIEVDEVLVQRLKNTYKSFNYDRKRMLEYEKDVFTTCTQLFEDASNKIKYFEHHFEIAMCDVENKLANNKLAMN